jgi:hypothetical protein
MVRRQLDSPCVDISDKWRCAAFIWESKNLFQSVPGSSLFAQQDRWIDGERALRRNPRGY